IPRVMELIESFGIPLVSKPGLEADDIIASITHRVLSDPKYDDVRIRIVSKDKDLEQLLCDRVTMFDIHKDTEVDVQALWETKGIRPDQVIDLLALTGDTADNVPGVDGIGPKTAAKLIQEFGSIEGILNNLDKIKGKRKENLEAAAAHLPLSIQLVTLKREEDLPFDLEDAKVKVLNVQRLIPLFQQLGFRKYQDDVRNLAEQMGIDQIPDLAAAGNGAAAASGAVDAAAGNQADGGAGDEQVADT